MGNSRIKVAAIALTVTAALAACAPSGESGDDTATDAAVEITFLGDITGAAAFCGAEARKGVEAAVAKVNEDKLLGEGELVLNVADTATDTKAAATAMTQILGSASVGVVIGCSSSTSQASTPIAQNAGMPVVAMQSGTAAVIEPGEFIFRATAPQQTYHQVQIDFYENQGAERAAILYQSDHPTSAEVGKDIYPDGLTQAGIDVVATESFQGADFDFAALASKVLAQDPDVVFIMAQGTPNAALAGELLKQGYVGAVGGTAGFAGGVLEPLGEAANGFTWPSDFSLEADFESTKEFISYFTDYIGAEPDAFAAEAWDATMLLAEGIAASDSVTREGVREGIHKVTELGLEGAVGPIAFEDRDARVGGFVVEWYDGATRTVK